MVRVLLALLLAGCGAGEGALRVTVDGTAAGAAYLQIVATVDGLTSQPAVVPLPDGLPAAFQLRFPRERHGPAVLHVEAMTEAGRVVAAGGAVVDVLPSFEMAARVVLSGEAVGDAGVPPPVDLAGVDFAGVDLGCYGRGYAQDPGSLPCCPWAYPMPIPGQEPRMACCETRIKSDGTPIAVCRGGDGPGTLCALAEPWGCRSDVCEFDPLWEHEGVKGWNVCR